MALHEIVVHKATYPQWHAGHAHILREHIDSSAGPLPGHSNLPEGVDWPAHDERRAAIADRFM